jgi:hypothetical protein
MSNIYIPNRFESVLEDSRFDYSALIYQVEEDLKAIEALANLIRVQNGGVLSFLIGASGVGKTTSVYSASIFIRYKFNSVLSVPHEIDLRDAMSWLQQNIPAKNGKVNPILFDGREVTDDTIGLKQFLSSLNQLLRRRNDLLLLWPTTDNEWHSELRTIAEKIGGNNLSPKQGDVYIKGPRKDDWAKIFERLLIQLDLTPQESGLDNSFILSKVEESSSIGDFLGSLSSEFAARITLKREELGLPEILFVVSSGQEVASEANRLRRAGNHYLKAEELVSYSPRSESGKWWQARSLNPQDHLAYVISLFNARLLTLSSSAVAYSCLHFGSETLQSASSSGGLTKHTTNLQTTFNASDFSKFFRGELSAELTSSRKGKNADATLKSFAEIQKLSAKKHKEINQAICQTLATYNTNFDINEFAFEVDAGEQNLFTDVIINWQEGKYYIEFHHLSEAHCNAAKIASYIMGKLQGYAIHYNVIPR